MGEAQERLATRPSRRSTSTTSLQTCSPARRGSLRTGAGGAVSTVGLTNVGRTQARRSFNSSGRGVSVKGYPSSLLKRFRLPQREDDERYPHAVLEELEALTRTSRTHTDPAQAPTRRGTAAEPRRVACAAAPLGVRQELRPREQRPLPLRHLLVRDGLSGQRGPSGHRVPG